MIDPLDINIDTNSVDTSRPVLAETLADLEIASAEVAENSRKDGHNLVVTYKTTTELDSIKGTKVAPGFQLKSWNALQSKDKTTGEPTEDWLRNIVQLLDAAHGTSKEAGNRLSLKEGVAKLPGKIVRARITVEDSAQTGLPVNAIRSVQTPS